MMASPPNHPSKGEQWSATPSKIEVMIDHPLEYVNPPYPRSWESQTLLLLKVEGVFSLSQHHFYMADYFFGGGGKVEHPLNFF
jgi:hypothetical protein